MPDWDNPDWGQGAQGAAGGAMSGAALGSVIPGVGTAIGAIAGGLVGGLAGLFGGGDERDEYQEQLRQLYSKYEQQARTMLAGPAAQAQQSSLVANRGQLINSLTDMSQGRGPSAAAMMMQQGVDQASRAATSMAAGAGGRGVNAGASMRNALNSGAAMQMQNVQNTGVIRAQEQLHAYDQLGNVIGQGIQSDQQLNMFNAEQENQRRLQEAANILGIDQLQLQTLMAGANMASPGTGTAILAGGAQAVPALLQYAQQKKAPGVPTPAAAPASAPVGQSQRQGQVDYGSPVTSPSQIDPLAPYRRPQY